jgi:hypothetical protein
LPYDFAMKYRKLAILLTTAIGAYLIGATDLPDILVFPFAAILLWVLINESRRGQK